MKNLLVVACLFLMTSFATTSKTPFHTEAINIDMNADLLIATSDNPNDPMRTLKVLTLSGQQVAFKSCVTGVYCDLNLSNLASGTYLAVGKSSQLQHSENIFVP